MQLSKSMPLKTYFSDLNQTLMVLLWFCKRILEVRKNVFQVVNIKVKEKKGCSLNHGVILVHTKLFFSLGTSTEI